MANMTQKMAYKFKSLSGGNEHQERVEQCFDDAFAKGYSVVEIARIAGMKSAKYIHAALVKRGVIPGAKRGRQPGKIVLPDGLKAALATRELTFAQWCAGWSIGVEEAAQELGMVGGAVSAAIKRDFPSYYSKITGVSFDGYEVGPEFEHHAFDVHFDWDGSAGCYVAEIKDLGIRACGESISHAFYLARMQRKDLLAIRRLEQMPNLFGENLDW